MKLGTTGNLINRVKDVLNKKYSPDKYIQLAELIVNNKSSQPITTLKKKYADYQKDPQTTLDNGYYSYETRQGRKAEVNRGKLSKKHILYFIMIDTLIKYNFVCEMDWKFELPELKTDITKISQMKDYQIPDLHSNLQQYYSEELMIAAKNQISKGDYRLVSFDTNSDSYVFTIIKKSDYQEIDNLLSLLGFRFDT